MRRRYVRAVAVVVLVASFVTASIVGSGDSAPPKPVDQPYFVGNAESGDLSQWPSLDNAHSTAVVRAPRIEGGHAYRFRVVPGQVDASIGGDMAYLDHPRDRPWEQEGANTWYRFRYLFASGSKRRLPGMFKPNRTPAGWNMIAEWHEPGCCEASPYLGVRFSGRGALMLRWVGGPKDASTWIWVYDAKPLLYDHWYDMVVHVLWSSDPTKGFVEWWADGRKVFPPRNGRDVYGKPIPSRFPTLWSVDGTSRIPWLEWGHYRGKDVDWIDTTYGDDFRIGPTRASVRRDFAPRRTG